MEQFPNYSVIALAAPVLISDTSIQVTPSTTLPTSGTYRLLVESEVMLATSRSGAVVQVTRGQEGTAAAAHISGLPVIPIVTQAAMRQLLIDAKRDVRVVVNGPQASQAVTPYAIHETNSFGGAVTFVPTAAAGPDQLLAGDWFEIKIDESSDPATNAITVNAIAGSQIENPAGIGGGPGTFAASVTFNTAGQIGNNVRWEVRENGDLELV